MEYWWKDEDAPGGWLPCPWPDTEGVLADGDLCDVARAIGPPEGRGDEVRYVGVAPVVCLGVGVAMFTPARGGPFFVV